MPDFDIDFSDERRDEIIEYVVEKIRRRPCGANRHASVPWPQDYVHAGSKNDDAVVTQYTMTAIEESWAC